MTLKEFYRMICNEFNDGKNLEYKWTRPDGYWKMTKGFINSGDRGMSIHFLAQYIREQKALKKEAKKVKRSKKIINKYKGD